jgi:uncharacterized protein YdeI (YjbR/CyaY-like superfamily)
MKTDALPHVTIRSAADLDAWLSGDGLCADGAWLIRFKKGSGEPWVPWNEVVDVLLCHGWIDSVPRKLDAARSMLLITPRRPDSPWSAANRSKVAILLEAGRMTPAGLRAVEVAKARGAWDRLVETDDLSIPADLGAALDAVSEARENFERFPKSARRAILEWITLAKRPETRARRVQDTAVKAGQNLKANHAPGRDRGPSR